MNAVPVHHIVTGPPDAPVVVLCTGARLEPVSAWHERAATVREHGTGAVAEAVVQRWFTTPYLDGRPGAKAAWEATVAGTPAEGYASCCEVIATMDLHHDLPRISAPTLAIAGADDGHAAVVPPGDRRDRPGRTPCRRT